jgi:hypothetical protein
MPHSTFVEMPPEDQAELLAALRRARYGSLLALHIVLWCAAGRTPTDIAAVLFCARSSVYRTVRAAREGSFGWRSDADGQLLPPVRRTGLFPMRRRSLLALLKAPPRAYGWCRTRWSCATLALTWQDTRGLTVSAETVRRWGHEVGWVWKRSTWVAKDDDPRRVERLARSRVTCEPRKHSEAMVFADELDIPLLPKVGSAWMPQGTPRTVMTPGIHEKHDLAGALDLATGALLHGVAARKTKALFRDLLTRLEAGYPAERYPRLSVVVDHDPIHHAKAVGQWLAAHPRLTLLWLPTYGPRANPIERAFGDGHDLCPRNHTRKRLRDLVADVEAPLHLHGPWPYQLSALSDEPAVTAAVEKIVSEEDTKLAACVYQSSVD